jgi:SET domain-containing protein
VSALVNWTRTGTSTEASGGDETQYINHSCEPNANVFIIDGLMIVVALREIVPGDEITVDYLNSFEADQSICHCHTRSCRQRIDQKAA